MGSWYSRASFDNLLFCPPKVDYDINNFRTDRSDLIYLDSYISSNNLLNKDKICVCIIRPKYCLMGLRKYIIFSHGNGSDIASLFEFGKKLADISSCYVVLYTYPGYGTSVSHTGKPNETSCYNSLIAVINYVKSTHRNNQILLIGQSLGTAVVIDYLSKNIFWEYPVILISPFRSVSRVIYDNYLTTYVYGKFDNVNKIKLVNCPAKIYHGKQDKLVKMSHSESLYSMLNDKSLTPTYIEEACHNNILDHINWQELNNIF